MYIEFDILSVPVDFDDLEKSIKDWAQKYQVPYTTKVAKGLKYRLGLNYPEHFTLFFVTWNGSPYKVKTPKNIDTSTNLQYKYTCSADGRATRQSTCLLIKEKTL